MSLISKYSLYTVGKYGDLNSIDKNRKSISLELRVYLAPYSFKRDFVSPLGVYVKINIVIVLRFVSLHSMGLSLCRDRGGFISSERRAVDPNQSKSRNPESP